MSILEALKQTKKGSLNYDRNWFDMGKIKEVLTECTSPPSLPVARTRLKPDTNETSIINTPSPPVSPNKSFNRENVEEILNVINKSHDPFVSPRVLEAEKRVKDYEDAWIMKARSAAEKKRAQFEKEWDLLQQQAETQLIQLNLKQELEAEASAQKIHALQQARCEEVQERQQHLKERHRRYAQALDNKMREAEAKRQQQEQEEKKRHEETQQRLGSILKVQQEVATVQNKVTELLASGCQYKQHLPAAANKCNLLMKYVEEEMGRLVQKAKDEGATAAHLQTVLDLNSKSRNALEFVVNAVDAANKKGKEEAEKQQEQQQQKDQQKQQQLAAAAAAAGAQTTSAAPSQAAAATAANNIPTQEDEVTCCAVDAFKRFTELQDKLKQVENMYQPLVTNAQLKKYKFELQKAVNTPVNAISATSGTHLMDKLQRLHAILSGQSVETGGKRVTSSEHPAGGAFCKDLLAKKIVKQGDEQVSSNFESAFPTAAVAVGIWYSFSDAGELMLAHFYKKCPYLVPYYVPKAEGQSNEDYFKALGYNYADNTVEKQDKFLKRMSGLTRLYAAILITPPPQGAQLQHPHGIENAWIWLVRVMNMQPRPDITATLVFDFLQVTGSALMKTYNKQFIKLLQILCSEFVPKIERVTIQGAGGPVSRLKIYLESCLKDGKMKPPAGMLPNNFWQS